MHWVVKFSVVCAGLIVLGLVGVWGIGGFASLGVEGHVAVAMFLGIFFTILVGVVLMALIFYSDRGGYDQAAQDATQEGPAAPTDAGKSEPP